jgi:H+-transporting ATPase
MVERFGLTSEEVRRRLQQYGPNRIPEERRHPLAAFLAKFWAPIPWMLEIVILLEVFLGKTPEAIVIGILLLFNAAVSFFQEGKARNIIRLLKEKLEVQVRVLRDGQWSTVAAQGLVPGDYIRIRMGDIVPADAKLIEGAVLIDQSALTGESLPVEPASGTTLYAGSIVKRGEAYAEVQTTGASTYFGTTAEIMRTTKTPSHLQRTIFSIVQYLLVFDMILVLFVFGYAAFAGLPFSEMVPFCLLLFVAAVPVALPATYALSTALGSIELAKAGVLVTRLSAIEEAAAMNVLCVDKTGTLTKNELKVCAVQAYSPYTEESLLQLASLACERATQDPLDLAILKAAEGCHSEYSSAEREAFIPFDPIKKCSEASIRYNGQKLRVQKGAPSLLLRGVQGHMDVSDDLEKLTTSGARVLAVILGKDNSFSLVGLIAFEDPPRETSREAVDQMHALGVKVMMVTGDSSQTARAIASQVDIGASAIPREGLSSLPGSKIAQADIISGVFPEDKFRVIERLQQEGKICGMTGDGVNDAPALKRAEVGIATSNATDVAKAAASLVLTNPGLKDMVEAVRTSRRIYQRMLTYTLNKIIKTIEISVLLGLGLVVTNTFIISQLLIVLLLFANDFVTMSISTDHVSYSQKPDQWDVRRLMFSGGLFAALILGLSFFVLYVGIAFFYLALPQLQTLIFLTLVFTGQANVYLARERGHFWHSAPSMWMVGFSVMDIVVVSGLAINGLLMAPLAPSAVLGLLCGVAVYFVGLDFVKVKALPFTRKMEGA